MQFFKNKNGALYLIYSENFYIQLWEDYSNIFRHKDFNWNTFTFIQFFIERDKALGGNFFEINMGILGFNLGFQINLTGKEKKLEINEHILTITSQFNEQTKRDVNTLNMLGKIKDCKTKTEMIEVIDKEIERLRDGLDI